MKSSVCDTYVQRPDGRRMHFDILVPATLKDHDTVLGYGRTYLAAKGIPPTGLIAEKCSFCHTESATSLVEQEVERIGFAVLELAACRTFEP